jgi:hypothetical protein
MAHLKRFSPDFVATATDALTFDGMEYLVPRDIMLLESKLWQDLTSATPDEVYKVALDEVKYVTEEIVLEFLDRLFNAPSLMEVNCALSMEVNMGVINIARFLQIEGDASDVVNIDIGLGEDANESFDIKAPKFLPVNKYTTYEEYKKDIELIHRITLTGIIVKDAQACVPWIRLANSTELMRDINEMKCPDATPASIAFSDACLVFISEPTKSMEIPYDDDDWCSLVISLTRHNDCSFFHFMPLPLNGGTRKRKMGKTVSENGLGTAVFYAYLMFAEKHKGPPTMLSKMATGDVDAWKTCFNEMRSFRCHKKPTYNSKKNAFTASETGTVAIDDSDMDSDVDEEEGVDPVP